MPQEDQKSIPQVVSELKDLTVDYAKQETIDPLKNVGRFVAFGVGGSAVLGLGLCLLGLALLRFLQTETDTWFTGNWSWAPYLIATIVLGAFAVFAVLAIKKDDRQARERREAGR